jgi:hypothetical protein
MTRLELLGLVFGLWRLPFASNKRREYLQRIVKLEQALEYLWDAEGRYRDTEALKRNVENAYGELINSEEWKGKK